LSASARLSACGLVLALAAAPASAHHSATATYVADETVAVKGKVLEFAWTNPHCHVYIDVAVGPFKGRTYTVELGSPSALAGDGWTKASLRPGDEVVMTVHPSRTGAASGLCRRCALSINGATWRGVGTVE
jgi:hypothetical protein